MAIEWTDEQKAIFDSHDKNILVSASAGSGKTTVMIQKIINLVLKEGDRTPISNFLVVTFTKASASDMKEKLIEAFMKHQDDEFCLKQIDDVETSDISNLHSFCSRLISTYFYEVNVDPSFQVIDGALGAFLQDKALETLFERKEKQGDEEYLKLFDIFQKKRQNKPLKNIIKRFNNFLNSNLNSEKWFNETLESAYNDKLTDNDCAKIINSFVPNQMRDLSVQAEKFASVLKRHKQDKLCDYFLQISELLRTVNSNNSFEVNAKNIAEIKIPTAPRLSANVEIKPQVDELKDLIKSQLENFQKNYICADADYLKQGLLETKQVVISLYNLVKEFNEIYDGLKKEINGLDFNDLEKKALIILQNKEILETLRKKYRYVFVDEYQDINSVQEEIISLVSGKNNRFMVGDIKQSIYRFRLCDPDIFMGKYEKYGSGDKDSELFKLNCNFRSDKKILAFVDLVFSGVMTESFGGIDYAKDSKFIPGENNLNGPESVNLFYIDTTKEKAENQVPTGVYSVKSHTQEEIEDEERGEFEAKLVASTIAGLIAEKGKDFKFSDVAVLVGSRNDMVAKFIETLKSFGIRVSSDEKYNLIEKVYVQEILNFVKLVCNKNDDFVLFKVLKSRLFNFSDEELVKIRLLNPRKRFFECINYFENLDDENLKNKIINFNEKLEKFNGYAKLMSVKKLCKKIIEEFSLYEINDASFEFEKANNDINMMIDALPETDAFDFVLNYENFSLEVENECGGDTVSVMTIHKSKGIEFKYVFLINTTNEFNFESTYETVLFNKKYGVGIDYFDRQSRTQMPTIASAGIKLLEKRKLVEEQQRVLYVALTRAKERLYVICSKEKQKLAQKIKEHKKCFADWFEPIICKELDGEHNEIINFKEMSIDDLNEKNNVEPMSILFKDEDVTAPEYFKYEFCDAQKFSLKTSISKILKGQETEKQIFAGSNSSAERGTDYHAFMQKIDFKAGEFEQQIEKIYTENKFSTKINIDLIKKIVKLSIFEEISKANYILTEREFYSKVATDLIENSNAQSEFILQGIIDLIAVFDDEIFVLDYKTGKISDEKLDNYAFQINTYSEIVERIFGKKVTKKILCFIDEQKIIEI